MEERKGREEERKGREEEQKEREEERKGRSHERKGREEDHAKGRGGGSWRGETGLSTSCPLFQLTILEGCLDCCDLFVGTRAQDFNEALFICPHPLHSFTQ